MADTRLEKWLEDEAERLDLRLFGSPADDMRTFGTIRRVLLDVAARVQREERERCAAVVREVADAQGAVSWVATEEILRRIEEGE